MVASEPLAVSRQSQTYFCLTNPETFGLAKRIKAPFAYATHELFHCCWCLFICVCMNSTLARRKQPHPRCQGGDSMTIWSTFNFSVRNQRPRVTCSTVLLYILNILSPITAFIAWLSHFQPRLCYRYNLSLVFFGLFSYCTSCTIVFFLNCSVHTLRPGKEKKRFLERESVLERKQLSFGISYSRLFWRAQSLEGRTVLQILMFLKRIVLNVNVIKTSFVHWLLLIAVFFFLMLMDFIKVCTCSCEHIVSKK